jgi:hypothetical protein
VGGLLGRRRAPEPLQVQPMAQRQRSPLLSADPYRYRGLAAAVLQRHSHVRRTSTASLPTGPPGAMRREWHIFGKA